LRIGGKTGEVFVDDFSDKLANKSISKKLKLGVTFGPSLNRAISYIAVLRTLEKQNISPVILTGTEMGGVVAAMYACGMTPDMIEWSFFKYFKEKKKNIAYQSDWILEIDEFFLKRLKSTNIENCRYKLFLTLFDHNRKKTVYFDKGNVRDLLLLNLKLSSHPIKYKTGEIYSNAFEFEIYNSRLLNQLGADFTMVIDAIGKKSNFEHPTDELQSLWTKITQTALGQKNGFDIVLNLPLGNMNLDSSTSVAVNEQISQDFMTKEIYSIKQKIEAKKEMISIEQ
jgi:hypothetical protein